MSGNSHLRAHACERLGYRRCNQSTEQVIKWSPHVSVPILTLMEEELLQLPHYGSLGNYLSTLSIIRGLRNQTMPCNQYQISILYFLLDKHQYTLPDADSMHWKVIFARDRLF